MEDEMDISEAKRIILQYLNERLKNIYPCFETANDINELEELIEMIEDSI